MDDDVKRLREEVKQKLAELGEALRRCQHYIVCTDCHVQSTDETCPDDEFGHGSGQCIKCGEYFGWYCYRSPDHQCYYHSVEQNGQRVVELANGQTVPKPADAQEYESDDWCLFCGQPDERK